MGLHHTKKIKQTHPHLLPHARHSSCRKFVLIDDHHFDNQPPPAAVLNGHVIRFLVPIPPRRLGWGDRIHGRLKPLTTALDRLFGSRLSTCQTCKGRKLWLNRMEIRLKTQFRRFKGVIFTPLMRR